MTTAEQKYYAKRGEVLVKNLKSRHFDAVYCATRQEALDKALEWIPEGSVVGWGGVLTAEQIGLLDALRKGRYLTLDREKCSTPEEKVHLSRVCLDADVFLTGANAMSLDGQMVNIDGTGNRVAAIIYGPKSVVVLVGMNKVMDTLDEAMRRARTVAAPMNKQRFELATPCEVTGTCADCKSEGCICNQIVITRHCRPAGRIKFVIVGENLGL